MIKSRAGFRHGLPRDRPSMSKGITCPVSVREHFRPKENKEAAGKRHLEADPRTAPAAFDLTPPDQNPLNPRNRFLGDFFHLSEPNTTSYDPPRAFCK